MNRTNPYLAIVLLSILLGLTACTFRPGTVDEQTLRANALHHHEEQLTVSATVISDSDAREIFGVGLGSHGIQAVWLEIDNRTGQTLYTCL